ncbi:unnamed protein product [Rotaria sp. Silwood2]|nr:unnamed protein product [Rotaria sp. Silwood2]CAF4299221.1 unnamed protein product [Rotaria sp. Silwood2]CAF4342523.1 unnamed protein product [Rotaria sp. Silwood2]
MERIFILTKTHLKLPDTYEFGVDKKTIKFIILLTIFIIFLIIISTISSSNRKLIIKNIINPVDNFYSCIAVLVEFRTVDHIIAIVHNVNHHIPSTWPIQIFHGKDNEDFIRNSTLAPLIASEKILLTFMNQTYDRARTNELLTDRKFWQRVRGEKILLFQIDSAMCSNSPHKITDFLQYDYIGAPWDLSFFTFDKQYRVGNGGFSLRSRSKIIALLALVPYDSRMPEDVWYAQNLHRVNGSIPSIEIAKTFSVESMYYARPLGVHRFPWHCRFRADLANTCPESMLIMPDVCH